MRFPRWTSCLALVATAVPSGCLHHQEAAPGERNDASQARDLGAIGGSAAAGALLGRAAAGRGKGALIGGWVGGGAATGAVPRTEGWQVVLESETPTGEALAVRS